MAIFLFLFFTFMEIISCSINFLGGFMESFCFSFALYQLMLNGSYKCGIKELEAKLFSIILRLYNRCSVFTLLIV